MTRASGGRRAAAALLAVGLLVACGESRPGPGAAAQPLTIPIREDPATFDPALITTGGETLAQNVFGGLLRYDDHLKLVPDVAARLPEVSADMRTYTFHLRPGVRFANGDPVTAADVVYSWSRTASRQGDFAWIFERVAGYEQVSTHAAAVLGGLHADDAQTVTANLDQPASHWLSGLGLPAAWLVDRKVIEARGEDTWWTTPEGLVGTGPYRMTARAPGRSIDFERVPGWWGTGPRLAKVHVVVEAELARQVSGYVDGRFDAVGYGEVVRQTDDLRVLAPVQHDPARSAQLLVRPFLRTSYLSFNFVNGPFRGLEDGRPGRLALSLAIDRHQLVAAVCDGGLECVAATGGIVTSGLDGFLGIDGDANARFDPQRARQVYRSWDPDGARLRGLTLATWAPFRDVAEALTRQWKAVLGIDVGLDVTDVQSLTQNLDRQAYPLVLVGWLADYNSPQDWLAPLYTPSAQYRSGACGCGYRSPDFLQRLQEAEQRPAADAVTDYLAANKMLIRDVAYSALVYGVRAMLVKPYVRGAGTSALYEYRWSEVEVVSH